MAARLALERKGVDFALTDLPPGSHPVAVRVLGFHRNTVPALRIDGCRIQGSRAITAYLERTRPEPPIFGTSPEQRSRIEAAELWGERELQPIPRRMFRLGATRDAGVMRWLAAQTGLPAPAVAGRLGRPLAVVMARAEGATEELVRRDLEQLPATLDRIDGLIAEGTIGGAEPNAADFQILTTVRSLLSFTDVAPAVEGRPCAEAATRIVPELPGPLPAWMPDTWLAPLRAAQGVA
jgi:glutathione S-transferase